MMYYYNDYLPYHMFGFGSIGMILFWCALLYGIFFLFRHEKSTGLQEMILNDTYCIDDITQTSAIKQALSGVEDVLMEGHLSTCLIHQIKKGDESKAIEEMTKVYRLKRR